MGSLSELESAPNEDVGDVLSLALDGQVADHVDGGHVSSEDDDTSGLELSLTYPLTPFLMALPTSLTPLLMNLFLTTKVTWGRTLGGQSQQLGLQLFSGHRAGDG